MAIPVTVPTLATSLELRSYIAKNYMTNQTSEVPHPQNMFESAFLSKATIDVVGIQFQARSTRFLVY